MSQPRARVRIVLASAEEVARYAAAYLERRGAWATGEVPADEAVVIELLRQDDGSVLELAARAVYRDGASGGTGYEIEAWSDALRARIQAWVTGPRATELEPDAGTELEPDAGTELEPDAGTVREPDAGTEREPETDAEPEPDAGASGTLHIKTAYATLAERLRNLPLHKQLRLARDGDQRERVALERMYGKQVWEALLRNPRVTFPEVARISRMGTLPLPLMEIIVGNAAWLRSPEIRRALLANPRLTADMIPRIVRMLPRHELKLLPSQTAYPVAVREFARRLLRGAAD